MNTNVNLEAAIGLLGFLGTCALLFIISLAAAHALFKRRRARLRLTLGAAAGLLAVYLGLMLVFSFLSQEKVLARGEEKRFCEIDCHLAYAVTDVQRTKSIGDGANQATARGVFYVVTIRTRFDEKSVTPTRGNQPLKPHSRLLTVTDSEGRDYNPSPEGMRALEQAQAAGTPIETPLRPGETYTTTFVFDLPEDAGEPLLLINGGGLITHLVIGHENSPLHEKVLFRLDDAQRKQIARNRLSKSLAFKFKGMVIAVLRKLKGYE